MTTSTEQTETVASASAMDTSAELVTPDTEEKQANGVDEEEETTTTESKVGKRKRSTKKAAEQVDNISNGRPKRNLSKRKLIQNN